MAAGVAKPGSPLIRGFFRHGLFAGADSPDSAPLLPAPQGLSMSLLYRVLYAVHARGTHHKLALDAAMQLKGADAGRWQRLLLFHAQSFMAGAKAPDDVFKDFKNHVLHPRDGYWGGAPKAARTWYETLVAALAAGDWPQAAHAAGVLSHYVTDAMHPFHTGQSEAENAIHRAFEWSTATSYDALKVAGAGLVTLPEIDGDRDDWLEDLLRKAALASNRHYEKLIAHYDITRGVVDPPAGLDTVAQRIVGGLILKASALFATVLQRAIAQSGATPPELSLTLATVLATLQIPLKQLAKRLANRADRAEVERMYDELMATGTVERNLPEDDRVVRTLHRTEVLGLDSAESVREAAMQAPPALQAERSAADLPASSPTIAAAPGTSVPASPLPALAATSLARRLAEATASSPERCPPAAPQSSVPLIDGPRSSNRVPEDQPVLSRLTPRAAPPASLTQTGSGPRPRLTPASDVVDAPSIGPRMAERLNGLGIMTVADLLAGDASSIADRLAIAQVREHTILDWQTEARIVCKVPGLTGTGSQLLVGAGFRDSAAIAEAEPDALAAAVLKFAATSAGQRILRDGAPPDLERIKAWADAARAAMAA